MNKSLLVLAGVAAGCASFAAPITPGNLVILRAGNGSAALTNVATAVFLDEYTTSGTLVQSIAVNPTGGMTITGNSTTEGCLSFSQDRSRIVMTGYKANAGSTTATLLGSNRVVGTLKMDGTVDTSLEVSDVGTANVRSATTIDGSAYYLGSSANVRYIGAGTGVNTSTIIDARNSRQVQVADNVLYASNGSTSVTAKVQHYGVTPTGATSPTAMVNLLTSDAVHGFYMLDLNAGIAGADTLYAVKTTGTASILKYEFDGTNWVARGSVASAGAQNVTAFRNGSSVDLYFTTATQLKKVSDVSGFGGSLSGTETVSTLATAATNTGFRGVEAVPEPASMTALAIGALAMLRRRRK